MRSIFSFLVALIGLSVDHYIAKTESGTFWSTFKLMCNVLQPHAEEETKQDSDDFIFSFSIATSIDFFWSIHNNQPFFKSF